jgi:hypothetical protein
VNAELLALVKTVELDELHNEKRRWAFVLACANSIRHLVEHSGALAALDTLQRYVDGAATEQDRVAAVLIATHHHGSTLIDGTAHALAPPPTPSPMRSTIHRRLMKCIVGRLISCANLLRRDGVAGKSRIAHCRSGHFDRLIANHSPPRDIGSKPLLQWRLKYINAKELTCHLSPPQLPL